MGTSIASILSTYTPVMRESALPNNSQLMEKLESLLRDKRLRPGDRFPSITELMAHFQVSRVTVQQVMDELAIRNLIVKRHGLGCFVGDAAATLVRPPCMRVSIPVYTPEKGIDYQLHLANMLAGAAVGLSGHGFSVNMVDCREDGGEFMDICGEYKNRQTDGCVLLGLLVNLQENLKEAEHASMPVVLLNKHCPDLCCVIADIRRAVAELAGNLLRQGKRKFWVCTMDSGSPRFQEIIEGVSEALAPAGLRLGHGDVKLFPEQGICLEETTAEIARLLRDQEAPEALFASPEMVAIAAAEALCVAGRPDVSLISVDNARDSYTFFAAKRVHRVKVPYFEMGRKAAAVIAQSVKSGVTPTAEIIRVPCGISI